MGYRDIYSLQNISGKNDKQAFIEKHSDDEWFKKFLYYALNPTLSYNISSKKLKKMSDYPFPSGAKGTFFSDIFQCCEYLSRLRGIDDATLRQVWLFLAQDCTDDERELYIKLLSKSLRLGITAKTVNKVIPGLIPEWEVQQAYSIDNYPISDGTEFWLTQKLNGVRATLYNGQLMARSGVPYKGVDHIINALKEVCSMGYVLDGELTLKDTKDLTDNEAFRTATGILNSESVDKTSICYTIFDIIPIRDFESASPSLPYSERRAALDRFSEKIESEYTSVLPVLYHGTDTQMIPPLLNLMVTEDKEGLMLNTDVPYKRTRHSGILKIKRFYTMDLPIIRCEEGNGRLKGVLGAFVVDYLGNEVNVGSGFTDAQREEYWNHRDDLTGVLCEIKYKEISNDKNTGLSSLQFPVFVGLRTDKTDISFA